FPKDVKALIKTANDHNYDLKVLKSVEEVNNKQKSILVDKIKEYFNGNLSGKTISLWGLAFKPHTDDMREAPSLVIIEQLLNEGVKIKAYDQTAMKESERIIGDTISYCNDQYDALTNSDALFIVTEWPEFRDPNFRLMKENMNTPAIFDGRNIFDSKEIVERGFEYFCIGVKTI
ncbi:MAG: UDP-glucose/GDP-mannose dehydrogenase family protein, partial [Candidatus Delongbacteria bacterium]|nr:UDP-glucose/GDP-mannose dehydrogenase family protein [Candidatus Delongbacteria bacterium]